MSLEQVVIPSGDPATEIAAFSAEYKSNVIVMVTEGVHGFLDILRGTTTDKVLRHAPCPVLAIPS
ncbi:universal stress protein [Roseiconus lacunae]|uniref:universal stress protein n=1 Tax=Roseiconus lacunae TaxID=2605694 RepID=UPI001E5C1417|nr:universal stress protein [Roseiconus lacunae]MCD0460244.1 universal stress protein [Roseiconus lacunae]